MIDAFSLSKEELAAKCSPQGAEYEIPLSDMKATRRRPYFFGRDWSATDIGYATFFVPMHLIALVAAPLTATPAAVQCCVALYLLTGGLGLSMSYHRQLSHKSFRCPKWLEFFFAYCGVLAFEGDPVEWAKNHNWHHRYTDTEVDRHTPADGFWHAHMGWLFDEQLSLSRVGPLGNIKQDNTNSVPWFYKESPRFYQWIRETYMYHQLGQAVVLTAIGGVPFLVWGFVVRILLTMHMTWLVNSAVHIWGKQTYQTNDSSRNNWLVALLVFGDGWHNNHHAFEYSARHGLEWWQVDISWYIIKAMETVGLAWDVKEPSEAVKESKRLASV
jgi:stearoyl-CoA desaturase (delta-9 desaturase)